LVIRQFLGVINTTYYLLPFCKKKEQIFILSQKLSKEPNKFALLFSWSKRGQILFLGENI
jgi:hypothetical protein